MIYGDGIINTRKATSVTLEPVVSYVKRNVNSGFYKWYHFTLDYYNGKPSFQGGTAYDLHDCYDYNGKPWDMYAIDLEHGNVYNLETLELIGVTV